MKYEWMRMASGIVDGSAYEKRGIYDSRTTRWREKLEAEQIDYVLTLDEMKIPTSAKAAFYAYVINGCSLEAVAAHFHKAKSKMGDELKTIMQHLRGLVQNS